MLLETRMNRRPQEGKIAPGCPFFYENKGRKLFGVHFAAEGEFRGQAHVLCNAFGVEGENGRAYLSRFARCLAARGCSALRFDYPGFGDSDGEFGEEDISSMCNSIDRSIEELKQRTGLPRVGLLGMRLGATLAALVSLRRSDIDSLVLWEPLVRPFETLYADLRATVTAQTVLFKQVHLTRDQIVENILAGRPSFVSGYNLNVIHDGFELGSRFLKEVKEIDLLAVDLLRVPKTQVLSVKRPPSETPPKLVQFAEALRQRGDCHSAVIASPDLPWAPDLVGVDEHNEIFRQTLSWLGLQ